MPTNRPIRRGQLITPFGVGALVDFRGDESLMTAGLEEWPRAFERCPADWIVNEERLQARLGVSHFRLPPDYREPGPGVRYANLHIPFVRFPQWHYCPRRGVMERLPLFGTRMRCPCRSDLDCYSLPEGRRPWLIPNRFIAVCPKGHIEDFPFMEWVHRGESWNDEHRLRLLPGRSSASLTGTRIECSCGMAATMTGVFNSEALHGIDHDCSGNMPWVGETSNKPGHCGQKLRVLQRGASNVYFPLTSSSIYLPIRSENSNGRITRILDDPRAWGSLTRSLDDGKYIQRFRCIVIAEEYNVDVEELRHAAQEKLNGTIEIRESTLRSEEEFRRQEYEALKNDQDGEGTDLFVETRDVSKYGTSLSSLISSVSLVRKLRETRALIGFSRILPIEDSASPELMPLVEQGSRLNWLPASVVRGEGIFIEFDNESIREWSMNPEVTSRISGLSTSYNEYRRERGMSSIKISSKFVLLHTIAHAIIVQLCYDCGYGSAAIRERIYCNLEDNSRPMQGVLIYTASGDSEGTLGGLVRQGEPDRLKAVFEQAIRRSFWCSSDPICIESTGQGPENTNLAACHGCVLIPETSCEIGNRMLDRGLLIGTPDKPALGFFNTSVFSNNT